MFGTILLAVDGSPHSEKAADLAAKLALAEDDTVVAVHVLERPAGFPGSLGIDPPENLRALLQSYAKKLESAGVKVTTDLRSTLIGHAAVTLIEAAKEHDAGLIVMGSRGIVVQRGQAERPSSTGGEQQPYSIEAQDARLDPYITSQPGWRLVGSYADDKSGATLDRPGLQRALADARAGEFDVLLVYRVDRLTRSIRGLLDIADVLDAAGVALCSASEHFDTHSPVGRMTMQLLVVFAEFERALIIERVVAGMHAKAATGGWTAGSHPFGYSVLKDPNTGKSTWLVPNDDAPLVGVIYELYAHQRMGAKTIGQWLNQHGHRTQHGKPLGAKAVLTVLRNRAYIGEICFQDTWYPAPHPPLIDRELFDRVQELLAQRRNDHARRGGAASDYLLSGLMRCARCGNRYVGTTATGRTRRYRYYTCDSRIRQGTAACDADRLPADWLDHAVLDALLGLYQHTRLIDQAIAQVHTQAVPTVDHHAELDTITAGLRRVERAIDRYYTAFEHGALSEQRCAQRVTKLEVRRDQLHARQADLQTNPPTAHFTPLDPALVAQARSRLAPAVRTGTIPTVKGLLNALVPEIRVESRSAIYPTFRVPLGKAPTIEASS